MERVIAATILVGYFYYRDFVKQPKVKGGSITGYHLIEEFKKIK